MAPIRPIPNTAFGFVLDDAFCRGRAQAVLDDDPNWDLTRKSNSSPEEKESIMESAMVVMTSVIAEDVYAAVPGLPCLQRALLPVKETGVVVHRHYVFVLHEDNRT